MRLPDIAAARLEWADFDGQGVREAAIGALRYIPAYASEARIAFSGLADALTTLRFRILAGCRFLDSFEYIESGLPRILESVSARVLISVNGPRPGHALDEMRRGLESIQRSRHIIYDELDGPVIGRMAAMCLSSMEDYVFVEASNKI